MLAGDKNAGAFRRIVYMKHIDLDPLVGIIIFPADHLALIQNAINSSEIDCNIAPDKSLNDTCDNLVLFIIIICKQTLSLRLTDLLKDHVLRVLDSDSAESPGVDVNIHGISKLILAVDHLCVRKTDLRHAVFYILDHFLGQKDPKRLLLLIHGNDDVRQILAVKVIPASLLQRFCDRLQKHLTLDVFFFLKDYESVKQFVVHFLFLLPPAVPFCVTNQRLL